MYQKQQLNPKCSQGPLGEASGLLSTGHGFRVCGFVMFRVSGLKKKKSFVTFVCCFMLLPPGTLFTYRLVASTP